MNSSADSLFSWQMDQAEIDLLAHLLLRLETISDTVSPGCMTAERAAAMLTHMREGTAKAGAEDLCPDRPLWPHLEDVRPATAISTETTEVQR